MAKYITLIVAALLAVIAVPAKAQLARTFVSASGSDANNCDRPTPCRTFQHAHDNTLANGEITVLDPGGYGAVTITKSISIVDDGVGEASILVSGGGTGITVNAGPASYVNLRGITIQGIGFGGGRGIRFQQGYALTIENCVIRNHTLEGILANVQSDSFLSVADTLVADNGGQGIWINPVNPGRVSATFNRVEVYDNSQNGFLLEGDQTSVGASAPIEATITDSVIGNNNGFGAIVESSQTPVKLVLVHSAVLNNQGGGISTNGPAALAAVTESALSGNLTTWTAFSGSALQSFGDNGVSFFNDDGGPPAPTPPTLVKE